MQNLRAAAPRDLMSADLSLAIVYARQDGDLGREAALTAEHDRRRAAVFATFVDPVEYRDDEGRHWVRERHA
jgi:hypothetical protein